MFLSSPAILSLEGDLFAPKCCLGQDLSKPFGEMAGRGLCVKLAQPLALMVSLLGVMKRLRENNQTQSTKDPTSLPSFLPQIPLMVLLFGVPPTKASPASASLFLIMIFGVTSVVPSSAGQSSP